MYSHAQNANACRRREPLIVPPFLCRLWLSPSFLLSCSSLLLRSSYRFIFSSLFPSFNILSLLKGSISRAQPGPLKPPSQRCSVLSPSQSLSLSFFFFRSFYLSAWHTFTFRRSLQESTLDLAWVIFIIYKTASATILRIQLHERPRTTFFI